MYFTSGLTYPHKVWRDETHVMFLSTRYSGERLFFGGVLYGRWHSRVVKYYGWLTHTMPILMIFFSFLHYGQFRIAWDIKFHM